jgi:SAM-dependent MidA family methyltransferase
VVTPSSPVGIPSRPELCGAIAAAIAAAPHQRLTFAQYMEMALYHPTYGYYSARPGLGHQGDFVTASHMGSDFGELLGKQVVEMWERLDRPHPFDIVEMGPGQGQLAAALLDYLKRTYPDCGAALQYTLVETSPALRQIQQQCLRPWQEQGVPLQWRELSQIAPETWTGCVLSNELVDALPVHRVVLTATGLQEQYVTLASPDEDRSPVPKDDRPFTSCLGPLSTPALEDYLQQGGITLAPPTYPLGYLTEVNLAALDWLAEVARCLRQGYVITIDYGYPAQRYYSPHRREGTLQCYWQQSHHDDPLIGVGYQDITAHVDFTALQWQGERCGLQTLGFTQQALFLMALGLGDRLNDLAQLTSTDGDTLRYALQRRETLHQLINPLGLGNFGVLIQGKGLTPAALAQPLRGLTANPFP